VACRFVSHGLSAASPRAPQLPHGDEKGLWFNAHVKLRAVVLGASDLAEFQSVLSGGLVGSADQDILSWISPFLSRRLLIRVFCSLALLFRCGNVASILELDEYLGQEYKVFQHAPSVSSLSYLFSALTATIPSAVLPCMCLVSRSLLLPGMAGWRPRYSRPAYHVIMFVLWHRSSAFTCWQKYLHVLFRFFVFII
jgi:hypothetical protein